MGDKYNLTLPIYCPIIHTRNGLINWFELNNDNDEDNLEDNWLVNFWL